MHTYATLSSVSLRDTRQATNASRLRFGWGNHRSRSKLLGWLTWLAGSVPTADPGACKVNGRVGGSCCDAQACLTIGFDGSVERSGEGTANEASLSVCVSEVIKDDV